MKYIKPINEFWGDVLKRDLLGETREEDKFHTKEQLGKYLKSEIKRQGENVVIQNLDVSLIDDLCDLFYNKIITDEVKSLDLSGWKLPKLKNMSNIITGFRKLESLNLSGWDISNIKDISWMFSGCGSLESLDLSGWKTSNVEDMHGMFYNCPDHYELINGKIVKR